MLQIFDEFGVIWQDRDFGFLSISPEILSFLTFSLLDITLLCVFLIFFLKKLYIYSLRHVSGLGFKIF